MIDQFIASLTKRMRECSLDKELEDMEYVTGASEESLNKLLEVYPETPLLLIELLKKINGTYWCMHRGKEIAVPILASISYEYPHYLQSIDQIIEDSRIQLSIRDIYGKEVNNPDWLKLDPRINPDAPAAARLHFSSCINNGGSSRLYIDFAPASGGTKGQIIQYVHDPDEYRVIADSFEAYLKGLIEADFPFMDNEEV